MKELQGKFIGTKEDVNTFVLEKTFDVAEPATAGLTITALGLYFAEINGKRVGDAYLTPGWTSYNKMLQVQTYDVTPLLCKGRNVIAITVNAGWYSGALTYDLRPHRYGTKTAVCAQLDVGTTQLCTDLSWRARESVIRFSGIYEGEIYDEKAECKVLTPQEVLFDTSVLTEQLCEPVRNIERLPVRRVIPSKQGDILDFGQNLAGVAEIVTPRDFSGTITLHFAEILVDGEFYTGNYRGARSTDVFTVQGEKTLCPEFTYHGFRYVMIKGAKLPPKSVTAVVRHTDMKRVGRVETSDKRINRLLQNVLWGLKSNFVDIPTDCPQRDERLGWTGDINVFCKTAAFYYDVEKILKKWLADLRNDQAESGEIPFVAPNVLADLCTSALWGDAVCMVPYALYCIYGDKSFLTDNFSAMKKYLDAHEKNLVDGLMAKGHEFGDWLALDNEQLMTDNIGRTDVRFLSSVFYFHSLSLFCAAAKILGRTDVATYETRRKDLLKRLRKEYFTRTGRLALDTVTAQTVALHFGIVPRKFREKLAAELNANVVKHRFRVTTGFIGTPFLLYALADNGYFETARRVLFNNACPGWLYEVDMNATTVWERWNSLLPDGKPNPDGMNSYNHYAYGAVAEFIVSRIAGLDIGQTGAGRMVFRPRPCKGIERITAGYRCIYGEIVCGYVQENNVIRYFLRLPEGMTAEVRLPDEAVLRVRGGEYHYERACDSLRADAFSPESFVGEVRDNPKALKIFDKVFDGLFTRKDLSWTGDERTLRFLSEAVQRENVMTTSVFLEKLDEANRLFSQ